MPAQYPASNDNDNSLWKKILRNPGGSSSYVNGDRDHDIMKKILRNQAGTYYPNSTDSEISTLRKILRNQGATLIADCGATEVEGPYTNDTFNRLLAKILINQNGTESYVIAMHDNAILKKILTNQATAVDAAGGDLATLEQIRKVIGPCGGGGPGLTNYIELPMLHNYVRVVGASTYNIQWRGVLQIWESGTVVFLAGELNTNNPAGDQYDIWVGSSRTVGAYQKAFDIAAGLPAGWEPSPEVVISPGVGESVFILAGDRAETSGYYLDNVPAFGYPDGFLLPLQATVGGANGDPASPADPYHRLIVTRTGDTINYTGDYVNTGSFVGLLYSWDWYDFDDWSSGGFLVRFAQVSGKPAYSYAAPTLADPTQGPELQMAMAVSGSNQIRGQLKLGPFLRAAPTIQQGTDPG